MLPAGQARGEHICVVAPSPSTEADHRHGGPGATERRAPDERCHVAVGLDIDGVLADYVGSLLRFLNDRLGTAYRREQITRPHVGSNLELPPAAYRALKREFRECGLEGLGADPIPGAIRFVHHLRARGYAICLLTGRPAATVKRLIPDTLAWLERHGVPYDECIFDREKADRLARLGGAVRPSAFIEDSPAQAVRIARRGIPVWLRRTPYSGGVNHALVTYFDDFESLHPFF
jgi:5' nucleotidase, deoxy (Pyrimidine), cytosolic type C protein (NT5C)